MPPVSGDSMTLAATAVKLGRITRATVTVVESLIAFPHKPSVTRVRFSSREEQHPDSKARPRASHVPNQVTIQQ